MVRLLRPIPRWLSRGASWLIVAAWLVQMGLLLDRSYLRASSLNLASDLHDAPGPDPDVRDAVTSRRHHSAAPDGEIEAAAAPPTFADLR